MEDDVGGKKKRKQKKGGSEMAVEIVSEGVARLSHNDDHLSYNGIVSQDDAPISLWIELEGCDPVPIHVRGGITVHEFKLLLGGFPTTSVEGNPRSRMVEFNPDAQKQQIELLGLRGVRPQQIKLKVDGKGISPPSKLSSVLQDGAIIHLQVVPSPITSSLSTATSSSDSRSTQSSTDYETTRLILDLRHEVDLLRRRIYSPTPKSLTLSSSNAALHGPPGAETGALLDSPDAGPIATRLEALEAKLDVKNSTFLPSFITFYDITPFIT